MRQKTPYPGVRYYEHPERIFKRQKDKNFSIRYRNADGKQKEEWLGWLSEGMTAQDASQIRGEIVRNIKLGKEPQSVAGMRKMETERQKAKAEAEKQAELENVTFGEAANQYLEWSKNNKKSYKADRCRYDKHLKRRFADRPMKSISPFDLEKLKAAMKRKNLTPATTGQVLQLIRVIYRKAIEWDTYQGNIPKINFPKLANRRVSFLTVEQVHLLLNELKTRSFVLWCQSTLAVYAGLRFGEIAKLTRQDINLESGTIHIRDTKSGYDRHAFITSPIAKMFKELFADLPGNGLLFPDRNGKVQNRVSPTFARIVMELELNNGTTDNRQQIVFHSLRHTFGSHLAMGGESLQTIQELMGHQNIETTMRYSHLLPDIKQKAVHNFAEIFEKEQTEQKSSILQRPKNNKAS